MNFKKIAFFLFISFTFLSKAQGQHENSQSSSNNPLFKESINYSLLIPFNDNGNWGWSDTLGNIIIKPAFKRTWFFTYSLIDKKKVYSTLVKTERGDNYYIQNIGLAVPAEYELLSWGLGVTFVKGETIHFNHIVKDENQKIGVFESVKQEMVAKPQYDSLGRFALIEKVILLKEKDKTTFDHFSPLKGSIEQSDIIHIDNLSIEDKSKGSYSCCFTVVKREDGTTEEIYKGEFKPFQYIDSLEYKSQLNTSFAFDEEPEFIPQRKKKTNSVEQADEVIATHDYSRYGKLAKQYGFTSLSIVRKDNKVGVVNELDEIIIPFVYDKIQFTSDYTQAQLFKNGKQGRKIFFTGYPLIEAKYDALTYHDALRVRPGWSFGIFEIKIGDFVGYVGENGVEYFKLD